MLPPSTSLGKPVFAKIAASEVLYSHRLHTEEPTDGPASRHTDLHSPLHTQSPCAGRLNLACNAPLQQPRAIHMTDNTLFRDQAAGTCHNLPA